MIHASRTLAFVLTLLLAPAVLAQQQCTPGDKKCGPDRKVLRCGYTDNSWVSTGINCAESAPADCPDPSLAEPHTIGTCTPGDKKCSPDRKVLRCTFTDNSWASTGIACVGPAPAYCPEHRRDHHPAEGPCTAGDKKCGPDRKVLRCTYPDNSWASTGIDCVESAPTDCPDPSLAEPHARGTCTPGDKKCGPDRKLLRCTFTDASWASTGIACVGPAPTDCDEQGRDHHRADGPCTPGDRKCGPDGKIALCSYGEKVWMPTSLSCE
jgi:hypothetical protein